MSRRGKPKTPEGHVLAAVLDCLRVWGLEPKRHNVGAANTGKRMVFFGERGDPDIRVVLPGGRACEIEVKAPGKRPRPEQWAKLRRCNEQGGVGLFVDDAAELARILPRLLGGARVEIDDDGNQWLITDDDAKGGVA